jgi:hypothetical protein
MADENETRSLHIDTDWKKQAQEEKRRLAEEQEKRSAAGAGAGTATASPATGAPPDAVGAAPGASRGRGGTTGTRELPLASFATLVQSIVTQILFYLGDIATRGGEPQINLDMAKHQIDMLGVLEDKTKGNLSEEEKRLLDAALYETRMRYVSVASQLIS